MSIESLIDKLGEAPSKQQTMIEAIRSLKNCPTFRQLVVATSTMTKEQTNEVFHAIAIIKAGIIRNAMNNDENSEDVAAFNEWPELMDFIDVIMEGLSNA